MKKRVRILSILLCFVFLFIVGCGSGEENTDDFDDEEGGKISTRMLEQVKVLSKPSSYNFKDAVGDKASENYYNIFAHHILAQIYQVYEQAFTAFSDDIFDFTGDELSNGLTYNHFENENQKYYLYDSLRYTITKVTSNLNEGDEVTSQTITIDLNKGWNWSVPTSIEGTLFDKDSGVTKLGEGQYQINDSDWLSFVSGITTTTFPSFAKYYTTNDGKELDGDYKDYFYSPFYKDGAPASLVNYYQDAFEYATYLFVLGFDYVDEKGQEIAEEKDYFNFIINLSSETPIKVQAKAFGESPISITDALGKVKLWYQQMGNIVGLTDKNKEQLSRFILDKVIGVGNGANDSPDQFEVKMVNKKDVNETSLPSLKFNRNYKAVVENIINYACSQTRIGYSSDTDEPLTLDNEYMASTVTDYPGNDFFLNYNSVDGDGGDDDGFMFYFIQPGEYQSFVLMPEMVDITNGLPLSDICLAFEYYNDDSEFFHDAWTSDPTKEYADEITINVGLRFFDKTAEGGEIIEFKPQQITIPYGRYDSFENDLPLDDPNKIFPDEYWLYMSTDEQAGDGCIIIDKTIKFDSIYGFFKNDIGDGAIDASKYDNNTLTISGTNKAREYYMTNPSTSYGSYGTLNYEKFMGADGCDFLEVYFDIVKDKTKPNINYNFKVGLANVFYDDGNHVFG